MKLNNLALSLGMLCSLGALASSPLALNFGNFLPKVIYGEDDRKDIYEAQTPAYRKLAASTTALFTNSSLTQVSGGNYKLNLSQFGNRMNLCKDEPYYDQPIGAFCSGSLVGPDLMMTAGHCIRSQSSCEQTTFVFNYAVESQGEYPTHAKGDDVYRCKTLLHRVEVGTGADYALVRLDRVVKDHTPLSINRNANLAAGTPLVVIGHPSGLPTKITDGAKVRDPNKNGYFTANLDTYGGNSGSAVFNIQTGLIEGILVRGENDFEYRNGCTVSKRCTEDGCRGEDVTKISELAKLIP
jgi:hypothetical protein